MNKKRAARKRAPTFSHDGYIRASGYRIRLRELADGVSYQLDLGRSTGSHVRKQFKSLDEAKLAAERQRTVLNRNGQAAFDLDPGDRNDAVEALKTLSPFDASLRAAAAFYAEAHRSPEHDITIRDLGARYLQDARNGTHRPQERTKRKLSDSSLRDIRQLTSNLAAAFGPNTPASTITTEHLSGWIEVQEVAPTTQANLKRRLSGMFTYGIAKGLLSENPAAKLRTDHMKPDLPEYWNVERAKAVLDATERECPRLAAYMALAFFAGIRPHGELQKLRWDDIDRVAGIIRIRADISKSGARPITIEPNLDAWLEKYGPPDARGLVWPLGYSALRRDRRVVAKTIGLDAWPADITRHTYASFHASRGDLARTQRNLGHSTMTMLKNHYDGLASPKEAEKYFRIKPSRRKRGEILEFVRAR